jgi:hypothetical protein
MVLKKWCAYTRAPSDTGSKALEGVYPPSKIRASANFFRVSVSNFGVRLGIRRGKIVDCGGSLAVRMLASVGYGVGNIGQKKKKDPRLLVSP